MDFRATARSPRSIYQWQTLIIFGVFLAALLSLLYTTVSGPGKGVDLRPIYDTARAWAEGDYNRLLSNNVYPPAMVVLTWPLTLFSFQTITVIWFIGNLGATALSTYLAVKLFGTDWSWRAKYFLLFFIMTWAPFRVMLRNGQSTMMIVALMLGSLLAWKRNQLLLAGILFGLALCKYTLTFPFFFYFLWQRQWQVVLTALTLQAVMTWAFVYRLSITFWETLNDYFIVVSSFSGSLPPSADLGSGVLALIGGNKFTSIALILLVVALALVAMFLTFKRTPDEVNLHLAVLALFALWPVYHRTYDFMQCLIPAALLLEFIIHRRFVVFSYFWLAALSLLALGLPGFVANRVADPNSPLRVAFALLLVQSERLLVLGMFWSLLWIAWRYSIQKMNQRAVNPPTNKLAQEIS